METQGLRLKISQSPVNEVLRCVNCPFIKKKKKKAFVTPVITVSGPEKWRTFRGEKGR